MRHAKALLLTLVAVLTSVLAAHAAHAQSATTFAAGLNMTMKK
jgi:hypothetical protein